MEIINIDIADVIKKETGLEHCVIERFIIGLRKEIKKHLRKYSDFELEEFGSFYTYYNRPFWIDGGRNETNFIPDLLEGKERQYLFIFNLKKNLF